MTSYSCRSSSPVALRLASFTNSRWGNSRTFPSSTRSVKSMPLLCSSSSNALMVLRAASASITLQYPSWVVVRRSWGVLLGWSWASSCCVRIHKPLLLSNRYHPHALLGPFLVCLSFTITLSAATSHLDCSAQILRTNLK
jgi:hypothetical protein